MRNSHKKNLIFMVFCIMLSAGFIVCAGDQRPSKIQLASQQEQDRDLLEEAMNPEMAEYMMREFTQGDSKPVFLVLPIDADLSGAYGWAESSVTDIANYLLSQYNDLRVFPKSKLQAIMDDVESGTNEDLISVLLQKDMVNYYVISELSGRESSLTFHYTLYDAKSNASLLDVTEEGDTVDGMVNQLNTMTSMIHDKIIKNSENEFTPLQSSYRALHYFVLGEEAAKRLNFRNALSMYIECLNEDPAFAKAYLHTITLYFQYFSDLFHSSVEPFIENAYRYSQELSEHDRMLLAAYNNYYFNKKDEALSVFSSLITYYPDSPIGYIGSIKVLLSMHEPERAVEIVNDHKEYFSDNIAMLRVGQEALNELGNFEKALETIRKYQALTDNSVVSMIDEAELLYSWGRIKESVDILEHVLSIDQENFTTLILIGRIYFNRLNFQRCINVLNRAITVIPPERRRQAPILYERLFLSNVYAGRFRAAQSIAEKLVNMGYMNSNLKSTLRMTLYLFLLKQDLSNDSGLVHAINSLLEIQLPDFQQARLLALTAVKSRDDKFLKLNAKVLEKIDDMNILQFQNLQELKLGYKAWYAGEYKEAAASLEKVLRYEYNSIVSFHLCKAYIELGDVKKAENEIAKFYNNLVLDDFESAYVLPQFYIIQAELLEKLGEYDKALKIYSNLLNMWDSADSQLPQLILIRERISALNFN